MDKEGTSRGDTTTILHNFSSRIFLVPTKKTQKCEFGSPRAENTVNTLSGSHGNFFEKHKINENLSEMDPYSTSQAETQAF